MNEFNKLSFVNVKFDTSHLEEVNVILQILFSMPIVNAMIIMSVILNF